MGSCLCCPKKPAKRRNSRRKSDSENVDKKPPKVEKVENVFIEAFRRQTMSILLVFGKDDTQCAAFSKAAQQAKYRCNIVKSMDSISSSCTELLPSVVIVDMRQAKRIESLCKTFSTLSTKQNFVLVAVRNVEAARNGSNMVDAHLVLLMRSGFTRQFIENFDVNMCIAELQCIDHGELQSKFRFRMMQSFVAAVENAYDSIEITNTKGEIMYVNSGFERLFGYSETEAIGKVFLSITNCIHGHKTDTATVELMQSQMKQGKAWKGILNTCKKGGEALSLQCNVIPISGWSGLLQNFVIIRRELGVGTTNLTVKGNFPSMGKNLSQMKIEAPMTKAINTILVIQETCPPNVAESLDNVLEMLRLTELYVPIKAEDLDNQMTNELLEGLMTSPTVRRPSMSTATSELERIRASRLPDCLPMLSLISSGPVSIKIQSMLRKESKWSFNILELERLTGNKPLQCVGMRIFERFNALEHLKIDRHTLFRWFRVVESHYHMTNPYHNSTHGGDVLHASSYFLGLDVLKNLLDADERICVLIAAVVHDIDHPGKTNNYIINSNSYLAQLYNDGTILENHHVSFAFRITRQDDSINIFKNLHRDDYQSFRQQIIDMVLATEMTKHMEHLSRFMHCVISSPIDPMSRRASISLGNVDNSTVIKRMLIKCADISNSARPWSLAKVWAMRITEEYFQQTEDEKAKGLPVVLPMFDRHVCNIPKSQIGFMSLFIKDMFEAWHSFCNIPDLIKQINSNFEYWMEEEKKTQGNASQPSSSAQPPPMLRISTAGSNAV